MPDDDTPHGPAGTSAAHWGTKTPEAEPDRDQVIGFGRLVAECRTRLGAGCTPEQVAQELTARGLEAPVDQVRAAWDQT